MAHVASASPTGHVFNAAGTAQTFSFDAGSSANRYMAIQVGWQTGSGHTLGDTAVTYNGTSLTPFAATINSGGAAGRLYGLHGPAENSNTVSVDPSAGVGDVPCTINVTVHDGIDSGTPTDGFTSATGTDATAELTVTSASGDVPLMFATFKGVGPTSIAPTLYTERWDTVADPIMSGGGEGTGAASVAFVATSSWGTAAQGWVAHGVNLNAAAAGAPNYLGVSGPAFFAVSAVPVPVPYH